MESFNFPRILYCQAKEETNGGWIQSMQLKLKVATMERDTTAQVLSAAAFL